MRGGMKVYAGSAAAARAYLEADRGRADDYYLTEGTGLARRFVAPDGPTGTYVDPKRARTTVGELADVWLAGKINLKPTSRARYADVLKTHVLPRWGNVALIRVTHGDVQAWLSELSDRGLAGASVRKAQGVLSGILGLAVRDRRLAVNPALGVALPPMQEKRRRYLTAEQLEALADAAGPGRVAVLVLGYCGLRWSELAALRVRHFDLLRRRVLVEEAVTEVD